MTRRRFRLVTLATLLLPLALAAAAAQVPNATDGEGAAPANATVDANATDANATDANATAPLQGAGDTGADQPEEAAGPAPAASTGPDVGVMLLVGTVVLIIAGAAGTWAINRKYHPPGEEQRRKNRPPQAR